MSRTSIPNFSIANAAYPLAVVTVYVANPDGSKGAVATLYAGQSGAPTLPNPQTLDATGKWQQPIYISDDVILEIDAVNNSFDGDTGIVSFGGKWRNTYAGGGTKYYRDDLILGPAGQAPEVEDNVYRSESIWTSTSWAADVADASKLVLVMDYRALVDLALAAVPDASETVKGIIELATQTEVNTGTDAVRAVTPATLSGRTATETRAGVAEVATQTETNTGANDTTIVTPAKLHARVASETLQGLLALATQAEANALSNDTDAVTPLKMAPHTARGLADKWIPASEWVPTITNGAARQIRELATNDLMKESLLFVDGSSKFATYDWVPPKGWDGGTVTFECYVMAQSGTASQTVEIELSGVAVSHDDAADAAPGTAGASTATYTAANDQLIGTTSGAITFAGSPANADVITLKITRDFGTDTLAATAEFLGINLHYTREAGNDA